MLQTSIATRLCPRTPDILRLLWHPCVDRGVANRDNRRLPILRPSTPPAPTR